MRILEGIADGQIIDGLDDFIRFSVSWYGCGFVPLSLVCCSPGSGAGGKAGMCLDKQQAVQACYHLSSQIGKLCCRPNSLLDLSWAAPFPFGISPSDGPATALSAVEGRQLFCVFTGVPYSTAGDALELPILLPPPSKY